MRIGLLSSGFVLVLLAATGACAAQSDELSQNLNPDLGPLTANLVVRGGITAPFAGDEVNCGLSHLSRCVADVGKDEVGIFSSPLRSQPKDAFWLDPMAAATGFAFAYDTDAERALGTTANRSKTADRIGDFGSFLATSGEGAGIYLAGLAVHNPRMAETGRLGAEAVIDSGGVTLALKVLSNRQRPRQGNGQGDFWPDGTSQWEWNSSFPSDHATSTMALARVIAGEYPRWYIAAPAYGFAGAVTVSQIRTKQSFPSDAFVGQAIGFLTGNYLLNHRSQYRPRSKRRIVSEMIESARPMGDVGKLAVGVSIEIPLGR